MPAAGIQDFAVAVCRLGAAIPGSERRGIGVPLPEGSSYLGFIFARLPARGGDAVVKG